MANVTTSTAGQENINTKVADSVLVSANYNKLTNKPSIDGTELQGEMSSSDLLPFMGSAEIEELIKET